MLWSCVAVQVDQELQTQTQHWCSRTPVLMHCTYEHELSSFQWRSWTRPLYSSSLAAPSWGRIVIIINNNNSNISSISEMSSSDTCHVPPVYGRWTHQPHSTVTQLCPTTRLLAMPTANARHGHIARIASRSWSLLRRTSVCGIFRRKVDDENWQKCKDCLMTKA